MSPQVITLPPASHDFCPALPHSSLHVAAQTPFEQLDPGAQALTVPHSRQSSASVSPQIATPLPSQRLSPVLTHSLVQPSSHRPFEQLSFAPHATAAPHSRQPSPLRSSQRVVALPSHLTAPTVVHASAQPIAQKPFAHTSPSSHAVRVPQSRQPSPSVSPHTSTTAPSQRLAPATVHGASAQGRVVSGSTTSGSMLVGEVSFAPDVSPAFDVSLGPEASLGPEVSIGSDVSAIASLSGALPGLAQAGQARRTSASRATCIEDLQVRAGL